MLTRPIPEEELVANALILYMGQVDEEAPIDPTELFITLVHNKGESKSKGNVNYRKLQFFSESLNREITREEFESRVFHSRGKNTAQCRDFWLLPLKLFDGGDLYKSCQKIIKRSTQQLVSQFNELKSAASLSTKEQNEMDLIVEYLQYLKTANNILSRKSPENIAQLPKAMETILASREPIEPEN
ncbi:MAG: hypothetical protein WC437_04910 [Patescibacteria group bacterium]|jgi:hypothetical protein